jgi:hypothetical protein
MLAIPPRRHATLARRIACGLPVWAVARASHLPPEELGALMWEPRFREMVGSWAEIIDMDPEAQKRRLLLLAGLVLEASMAAGDERTALLVQREYRCRRDPVVNLAKGFAQIVEREQAKAERERERLQAEGSATAPEAAEAASVRSAAETAVAGAEAARRIPAAPHPDDRALWRKAGQLRRQMFEEEVLHHSVVRKAMIERLLGPPVIAELPPEPEWEEAEEPEASPPPEPRKLNREQRRRLKKLGKAGRTAEPQRRPASALDHRVLRQLREKFARLPPSSLMMMVERAPPDLAPYFAVLDREAKEGKLWPQGP